MANVTMTFDAESARAVQAFITLENRSDALKAKASALKSEFGGMAHSGKDVSSMMASMGGDAGTLINAFLGVGSAIGGAAAAFALYKKSAEEAEARAKAAAGTQITSAQARATAVAAGIPSGMSAGDLDRMTAGAAKKYQIPMTAVQGMLPAILTEAAGKPPAEVQAAIEEAARLYGPGALREAAGPGTAAALHLGGVLGTKTLPETIGFARQAGQQLGILGLEKQAAAISPLAAVGRDVGWGPQEALALAGYMHERGGMEGETAAMTTAKMLETMKGAIVPHRRGKGMMWTPLKSTGPAMLDELAQVYAGLSDVPISGGLSERAEFEAKLPARQPAAKEALLALIKGSPEARAAYAEQRRRMPAPGAAGTTGAYEQMYRDIGAGPQEQMRVGSRATESFVERLQNMNPAAQVVQMREELKKVMSASGMGGIKQWGMLQNWYDPGVGRNIFGGQVEEPSATRTMAAAMETMQHVKGQVGAGTPQAAVIDDLITSLRERLLNSGPKATGGPQPVVISDPDGNPVRDQSPYPFSPRNAHNEVQ